MGKLKRSSSEGESGEEYVPSDEEFEPLEYQRTPFIKEDAVKIQMRSGTPLPRRRKQRKKRRRKRKTKKKKIDPALLKTSSKSDLEIFEILKHLGKPLKPQNDFHPLIKNKRKRVTPDTNFGDIVEDRKNKKRKITNYSGEQTIQEMLDEQIILKKGKNKNIEKFSSQLFDKAFLDICPLYKEKGEVIDVNKVKPNFKSYLLHEKKKELDNERKNKELNNKEGTSLKFFTTNNATHCSIAYFIYNERLANVTKTIDPTIPSKILKEQISKEEELKKQKLPPPKIVKY